MKVSDIIADFLIHNDITTVFGIIGSANSHIYDSFAKSGIRILNVHNEQCAVISAGSYFRTCGKLAVALVTAGGGVTNSVTIKSLRSTGRSTLDRTETRSAMLPLKRRSSVKTLITSAPPS